MVTQPPHDPPRTGRAPVVELLGRLLLPVIVLAYVGGFLHSIWHLGPRAATYPRVVIALLTPITLWVLGTELRGWSRAGTPAERAPAPGAPADGTPTDPPGDTSRRRIVEVSRQWRRSIVAVVTVAAFMFAAPRLGFYLSAGAYLLVTMWLLGVRNVAALAALTAGGLVFSYLFFFRLLGLLLPSGLIG